METTRERKIRLKVEIAKLVAQESFQAEIGDRLRNRVNAAKEVEDLIRLEIEIRQLTGGK